MVSSTAGKIFPHDFLALFPVSVTNGFADGLDRLVARQHLGDREETGLQDGVHARTHACVTRHLVGIDHKESGLLGNQLRLHFAGQMLPHFVFTEGAVEQEDAARDQGAEHVIALEEDPLMASDEVGFDTR